MASDFMRCPECGERIAGINRYTSCDRCDKEVQINPIGLSLEPGWVDRPGTGLLCPECNHAFNTFMKAGTDGQ